MEMYVFTRLQNCGIVTVSMYICTKTLQYHRDGLSKYAIYVFEPWSYLCDGCTVGKDLALPSAEVRELEGNMSPPPTGGGADSANCQLKEENERWDEKADENRKKTLR